MEGPPRNQCSWLPPTVFVTPSLYLGFPICKVQRTAQAPWCPRLDDLIHDLPRCLGCAVTLRCCHYRHNYNHRCNRDSDLEASRREFISDGQTGRVPSNTPMERTSQAGAHLAVQEVGGSRGWLEPSMWQGVESHAGKAMGLAQ